LTSGEASFDTIVAAFTGNKTGDLTWSKN